MKTTHPFQTDKWLAPHLVVSASSMYRSFKDETTLFLEEVTPFLQEIRALFPTLKREPTVRVCHIRWNTGMFYGAWDPPVLMIDARLKLAEAIETLIHEYVHAEQWDRGDIVFHGGEIHWKQSIMIQDAVAHARSEDAYKALPWEQEAYERAAMLYHKHFAYRL